MWAILPNHAKVVCVTGWHVSRGKCIRVKFHIYAISYQLLDVWYCFGFSAGSVSTVNHAATRFISKEHVADWNLMICLWHNDCTKLEIMWPYMDDDNDNNNKLHKFNTDTICTFSEGCQLIYVHENWWNSIFTYDPFFPVHYAITGVL